MSTRWKRVRPGSYVKADGTATIQRVSPEAREAGYSDGWHLTVGTTYFNTFPTKRDAVEACPDGFLPPDYEWRKLIMSTYTLPFGDKVRVQSQRRYVLVRQYFGLEDKPYIVRRSDAVANLAKFYRPKTDYYIDQTTGAVTFHFNGRVETHPGKG